jgi:hypothetical protein
MSEHPTGPEAWPPREHSLAPAKLSAVLSTMAFTSADAASGAQDLRETGDPHGGVIDLGRLAIENKAARARCGAFQLIRHSVAYAGNVLQERLGTTPLLYICSC